jgi:hypothetical protein
MAKNKARLVQLIQKVPTSVYTGIRKLPVARALHTHLFPLITHWYTFGRDVATCGTLECNRHIPAGDQLLPLFVGVNVSKNKTPILPQRVAKVVIKSSFVDTNLAIAKATRCLAEGKLSNLGRATSATYGARKHHCRTVVLYDQKP